MKATTQVKMRGVINMRPLLSTSSFLSSVEFDSIWVEDENHFYVKFTGDLIQDQPIHFEEWVILINNSPIEIPDHTYPIDVDQIKFHSDIELTGGAVISVTYGGLSLVDLNYKVIAPFGPETYEVS